MKISSSSKRHTYDDVFHIPFRKICLAAVQCVNCRDSEGGGDSSVHAGEDRAELRQEQWENKGE